MCLNFDNSIVAFEIVRRNSENFFWGVKIERGISTQKSCSLTNRINSF